MSEKPKVVCCVCGDLKVTLYRHLKSHGLNKIEYLKLYPDADLNEDFLSIAQRKGGYTTTNKLKNDPEGFKKRVSSTDWNARNKVKHETCLKNGVYERYAEKMQKHRDDPLYRENHRQKTIAAMNTPEMIEKLNLIRENTDPAEKERWRKNVSKGALNMSPEKRAKIDRARLESSKLGSKKERKLFELLCEKYPEGDWKLHTFIQTGDPYSKSGMRQIDMMSKTWNLYIEWNGYLHFINPWGDTDHLANIQNIEIWKKEAVEKKGGIYISIKDWDPVISIESALKIIEAHIPSEPVYNNDLFV
jgi:hypothetical protein